MNVLSVNIIVVALVIGIVLSALVIDIVVFSLPTIKLCERKFGMETRQHVYQMIWVTVIVKIFLAGVALAPLVFEVRIESVRWFLMGFSCALAALYLVGIITAGKKAYRRALESMRTYSDGHIWAPYKRSSSPFS